MIFETKKRLFVALVLLPFAFYFVHCSFLHAQSINVDASQLLAHVEVSLSPSSGSFIEGSTFQVPVVINTKNKSINGIEVKINFDKNKLSIVNPAGGTSIIGVWVAPPSFDNTLGTVSYSGVIPGGITTGGGLIGTITFKAKVPGDDGLGTSAVLDLGRADYNILVKPPEGVQIFSQTHPIQQDWYNNNTPTLSWVEDPGVTGFSYVLDNAPNTIPGNTINTTDTTKTFESLADGLWYFHIKAFKAGAWGTTGNFLIRIDVSPPAQFKPQSNYLVSSAIMADRTLISFNTTDNLSGIDHYEIGIIDKSQPPTVSPVFVQAESPFQVPLSAGGKLQVIVRSFDKAGNVRDEKVDVQIPFAMQTFIQKYLIYILIGIILLGFVILIIHYLAGYHIIRYINKVKQMMKKEETEEAKKTILSEVKE